MILKIQIFRVIFSPSHCHSVRIFAAFCPPLNGGSELIFGGGLDVLLLARLEAILGQ
jgi:hypothetical protein